VPAEDSFDARATLEAIDSLGYLLPSALPSILALMQDAMIDHPKKICTRYRGTGPQLSRDEKRVVGVRANAFLSRQAFDELTERGKTIPLQAHELTLLRAEFTRCRKSLISQAEHPEFGPQARFTHVQFNAGCRGCARLKGFGRVPAEYVQIMPPIDCETETCNLMVDVHMDWLAM
jgi:hypothetical protein